MVYLLHPNDQTRMTVGQILCTAYSSCADQSSSRALYSLSSLTDSLIATPFTLGTAANGESGTTTKDEVDFKDLSVKEALQLLEVSHFVPV